MRRPQQRKSGVWRWVMGALLALSALGPGEQAAAAEARVTPYEGVDADRIPQPLRRFYMPLGVPVVRIRVAGDALMYALETPPFKARTSPSGGERPEEREGSDTVSVNVYTFDTARAADEEFARRRNMLKGICASEYLARDGGRCVEDSLAPDIDGAATIYGRGCPNTSRLPCVNSYYTFRARGPENALVWVEGRADSNWSTPDTRARAVALALARAVGGSAPAPSPPQASMAPAPLAAARIQAASDQQWSAVPPLEAAKQTVLANPGPRLIINEAGKLVCFPQTPNLPEPKHASGGRFRLVEAREVMVQALRALGLTEGEIADVMEGASLSGDRVPAAVRERAYILWGRNRISHSLFGAQLVLSPAEWPPGLLEVQHALDAEPCPVASSEHASIRGTINGGGDFIRLEPAPPRTPFLTRAAMLSPVAAVGAGSVIELPGAVVTLAPDAVAAIDLAPNGLVAAALLAGSGEIAERSGGAARPLALRRLVVAVPGLGASPPVDLAPRRPGGADDHRADARPAACPCSHGRRAPSRHLRHQDGPAGRLGRAGRRR